jgi:hypothetical protein
MKKSIYAIAILLCLPLTAVAAQSRLMAAQQAYQEGLFLQRTTGDLDKALAAFDRALEAATDAEDPDLVESALLRRSEIFQLLGRSEELVTTIAALRNETSAKDADLGPARFFPPESEFLFHIDLEKLWATPLLKELGVEAEIKGEDIEKMKALLGFDPLKDLHEITIGATLGDNEEMPVDYWIIEARGNLKDFDPDKVVAAQKEAASGFGLKTEKIHGVKAYSFRVPLDQDPKHMMAIAFARLDDSTFLLGDRKSVGSTLAARAGKAPGLRANPKLTQVAARIPAGATFWLAGTPDRILDKIKKFEGVPKNLPAIEGVLLTGTLAKDFAMTASAWAGDAESAAMLGDVLRGLVALAQFAPMDEPEVKKVIRSLSVATEGLRVSVSATIPGELMTEAAKAHGHQAKAETVRLVMKVGEKHMFAYKGLKTARVEDPKVADVMSKGKNSFEVKALGVGETKVRVKREGESDLTLQVVVGKK